MKIIWSLEANKECEDVITRKSFILNSTGGLIRKIGNEADQTFYTMTKDPGKENRELTEIEKKELLSLTKDEYTFEHVTNIIGIRFSVKENKIIPPQYHIHDTFTLKKGEYEGIKEDTKTTVGRYILNRILYSETPLVKEVGYVNEVLFSKVFGKYEQKIADALFFDRIQVSDVTEYIDVRDWMGFQFHILVCASFTPNTIKTPEPVKKLRKELFKKYEKELEQNDTKIMSEIEKQLIDKTMEVLKDDVGMDLYVSGARGSVGNNMKNMYMVRGSVFDPNREEFDVVLSSINDGIQITDIPASSNAIVNGAFPKSCGTQVSGYLAKQLLASCQTEVLDDEGTDCGTKRGIEMIVREKHLYRYIIEGNKMIQLTSDNIGKYLGKKVMMRSPMSCILTKKGLLCNKCVGDFYYRIDNRNIGLSASKVGTSLTNLGMKKFHDNVIRFHQLDPDDMLL